MTCVEINGCFTRDLMSNSRSHVIVQNIVRMAKSLKMECVAECVETSDVMERQRQRGGDCVQGYFAHRPEPLREVLDRIKADESQRLRLTLAR